MKDRLVEGAADVAQILPDHLLGEALPCHQEPGHSLRRVVQEALANQIMDTSLRFLVENVEASSVMSLPDHFIDRVVSVVHVFRSAQTSTAPSLTCSGFLGA